MPPNGSSGIAGSGSRASIGWRNIWRNYKARSPEMSPGDSAAADRELTVSRVIDAPRPLVFKAWTDAAQVARWWGPKGFTTVEYEMDVRPGGAYRLVMRSPEGTDHRKRGGFSEMVAPGRVVFSFSWGEPDRRP